jgi:hypothetical protein
VELFVKENKALFSVGYILKDQSFLHGVKIPLFFLLKRMNVYDTWSVPKYLKRRVSHEFLVWKTG